MVAIPTSPADAFVNPPAAFPSPSAWQQRGSTATTTPASSTTPTATALFSGRPIAADASERECTGGTLWFATGGGRRHRGSSSALSRPLYASSPGGDTGAPESSEGAGDEDNSDPAGDGPPPGVPDSEKLREKLETIAQTAAPIMDDVDSGGLTQDEQAALEELQEEKRMMEEMERLEAKQREDSKYVYMYDGEEEDPDAGVRAGPGAENNTYNKCYPYTSVADVGWRALSVCREWSVPSGQCRLLCIEPLVTSVRLP